MFEHMLPKPRDRAKSKLTTPPRSAKSSMGDMAYFSPEQKALYLAK
jgi:hypothetical protein